MRYGYMFILFALLVGSSPALNAQEPAKKKGLTPSYTVLCKVTRSAFEPDAQGKPSLEKSIVVLPEITTLEGTKGEYVSERKIQAGVYQFRLQVTVQRVSEGKVRLELVAEDTWSQGPLDSPVINKKSLQTTRQVTLGNKLKLSLDERNDKGEGVWVELTVKEAAEDE